MSYYLSNSVKTLISCEWTYEWSTNTLTTYEKSLKHHQTHNPHIVPLTNKTPVCFLFIFENRELKMNA